MKILGLNFGHDAGISLIVNGEFIRHWEKERHCGVKHAIGLRQSDIDAALVYLGVGVDDIDMVALTTTQNIPLMLYDGIRVDFEADRLFTPDRLKRIIDRSPVFFERYKNHRNHNYRYLLATLDDPPDEEVHVREPLFPILAGLVGARYFDLPDGRPIRPTPPRSHTVRLIMSLSGRQIPGLFVSHHFAHAWYAYSQCDHDRAVIVTFDHAPAGRFRGGGLYFAGSGRVAPVIHHNFAIGQFYARTGDLLGLGPIGSSGKLMGLAAWGRPVYADPQLFLDAGKSIKSPQGEPIQTSGVRLLEEWISRKSIPRPSGALRHSERPPQIDADIAASAQAMFEVGAMALVDKAVDIARAAGFAYDGILLSGGCALNCPANTAIYAKYGPHVFVPPAVNDEGNSAGAAMCCACLNGDSIQAATKRKPGSVAYKGVQYDVPPALLDAHPRLGQVDARDAATFLARKIAGGAVVALFDGNAEIGPRALGHRSIIASPLVEANWRRVNRIKNREFWRPLAPIVLDSELDRHFEGCPAGSYYMLFNAKVRGDHLPAITHRDGTARVQVAVAECGFVYRLLEAFRDVTGIGVLLNTSLNGRGKPIVETPQQALAIYEEMEFDFLYLQGLIVSRAASRETAAGL